MCQYKGFVFLMKSFPQALKGPVCQHTMRNLNCGLKSRSVNMFIQYYLYNNKIKIETFRY